MVTQPIKKTWQFSISPKSSESSLPILRDDYQSIDRSNIYIYTHDVWILILGWMTRSNSTMCLASHICRMVVAWCCYVFSADIHHCSTSVPSTFGGSFSVSLFSWFVPFVGYNSAYQPVAKWDDPPSSDQQWLSLRQARRLAVPLPVGHSWVCWKDMQNLAIFPGGWSVNDGGLGFYIVLLIGWRKATKVGGTWHMFFSAQHIWILTYETWESPVTSKNMGHS